MTATYKLPNPVSTRVSFRSRPVDPTNIAVVIPVYRDWEGLRVTLESLSKMNTQPKSITVVNDNPEKGHPDWLSKYPVFIKDYDGNRGPAYARNIGFGFYQTDSENWNADYLEKFGLTPYLQGFYDPRLGNTQSKFGNEFYFPSGHDWFYFTDCGCQHATKLFESFASAWHDCGDSTSAICGPVQGNGNGLINRYMTEQGVLNPPMEESLYGYKMPQSIVTANVLVSGLAFSYIGGFDIDFTQAAGEDLDLGLRLRHVGMIAWSAEAKVQHQFQESKEDFIQRFRRYGRGNRLLEIKHNLPSLRARKFKAELPELQELADLQFEAMCQGYDSAVDGKVRGFLVER